MTMRAVVILYEARAHAAGQRDNDFRVGGQVRDDDPMPQLSSVSR